VKNGKVGELLRLLSQKYNCTSEFLARLLGQWLSTGDTCNARGYETTKLEVHE